MRKTLKLIFIPTTLDIFGNSSNQKEFHWQSKTNLRNPMK